MEEILRIERMLRSHDVEIVNLAIQVANDNKVIDTNALYQRVSDITSEEKYFWYARHRKKFIRTKKLKDAVAKQTQLPVS